MTTSTVNQQPIDGHSTANAHDDRRAQCAAGPAELETEIRRGSEAILKKHSRSFDWAAKFFPAETRGDAAVVYAFCRTVDDLMDETEQPREALACVDALRRELLRETAPRPVVAGFLNVAHRRGIDLECAHELIDGIASDAGEVRLQTDGELLRYCYRVAGTVGLMMAPLIGVRRKRALPHAVDLGVAMQLTNICRDVLEDARRGRVYLPERRLRYAGTSSHAVLDGTADPTAVAEVVRDILRLADTYYASADDGMRYIAPRCRLAILVASRIYRAIGLKLRANGCDALAGRTVVGPLAKAWNVSRAVVAAASPSIIGWSAPRRHRVLLHSELIGLPGIHGSD